MVLVIGKKRKLAAAANVEIEFAPEPEPLGDGPSTHMMYYQPGSIRIEFIVSD